MNSIPPRRPPRTPLPARDAPFVPNYPQELPIVEKRDAIVRAIAEHQVLVVTGETGSGKSTQLPKFCLEAGRGSTGLIGCTQPRRIAAITLAARVSEELRDAGPPWVGYKIRFQDRTARTTRIKFMTDGILLAEAQRDRLFRAYDTIIVDEAHERTLNIDFLLGLLKRILPERPDLKVIVTSATIDPEKFSRAFGGAPIIEVSGRTYPVETWYRPLPEPGPDDPDAEEVGYVDRAVAAVDEIRSLRTRERGGDILIFMPTESDIRETVQRLEEKRYFNTVVLPLFGRMASSDQQRVFHPVPQEKIVVATNVAETSITIPRIRYAIDTGLARISRYNSRSRTRSLPISRISRAGADQRKGRCGRMEAGICIRLFSEEDYLDRPLYTPPEIQRANLAEVILRMLYLRLGNIQDFPFLDPPSPASIKDGFGVLTELRAVDDHRRITPVGRMMARLPLDPRLSRMLLEARSQGALAELTVLAAALSIQDPKERPLDQEAQADQVHALFRDRRSDFVGLLKIWQACRLPASSRTDSESPCPPPPAGPPAPLPPAPVATPAAPSGTAPATPCEPGPEPAPGSASKSPHPAQDAPSETAAVRSSAVSRGRLRRFCRDHFLSYRRMREWMDVHEEIRTILDELGNFTPNSAPASYDAIHRSVLSGYLSNIAFRKEKNTYLGSRNRQVVIFPGSGLFNKGGGWIVAAEIVQTSRLFARTAADVQPEWIEEIGSHLCRSSYSEPHWERKAGQVTAFEKVTLYGLTVVDRRKVSYGRIHPEEAREIFIRSALVEGDLPPKYGFLDHNRELIRRIEELESKARRRDLLVDDEAIFQFYEGRLPVISDIRSFDRFLKDRGGDHLLRMSEADLLRVEPDFAALEQFPDSLDAHVAELPLHYAFHPGAEDDGITARIPVHAVGGLSAEPFRWLVPGILVEKVLFLMKALPKGIRKQFVPVGETAQRLAARLRFGTGRLSDEMSLCLFDLTGIRVPPDQWDEAGLPEHLRMRFEVLGPKGETLGAGRDLDSLKPLAAARPEDGLWKEARKLWEREGIGPEDFGEIPGRIDLGKDALGLSRHGFLGLRAEEGRVSLRLFETPEEAESASCEGLKLLYLAAFDAEIRQLRKGWVFPADLAAPAFFMGTVKEANRSLEDYLVRELFDLHGPQRPDCRRFRETRERLAGRLGPPAREMMEEVFDALRQRENARSCLQRFRKMARGSVAPLERLDVLAGELDALVPGTFLDRYRRDRVKDLPRYLRALQIRAERTYAAPEKDRLKADQLVPHLRRIEELKRAGEDRPAAELMDFCDDYRWMVEEFKIGLFAPEIKTRFRVSARRLDEKWQEGSAWTAAR